MPPKHEKCPKCGGMQSHLDRHVGTCVGSVVENKLLQMRGLKRGRVHPPSTRVLRSRAGTSDLPKSLLRLTDIGAEFTDAFFHTHAMSVNRMEGRGTSLVPSPSVGEEAKTASKIIKCMHDIYETGSSAVGTSVRILHKKPINPSLPSSLPPSLPLSLLPSLPLTEANLAAHDAALLDLDNLPTDYHTWINCTPASIVSESTEKHDPDPDVLFVKELLALAAIVRRKNLRRE